MRRRKKPLKALFTIAAILSSVTLAAETYSIVPNARDIKDSGDLIVNLSASRIQIPPAVRAFQPFGSGSQSRTISVGDGRHGAFSGSTYSNFSKDSDISGNTIRIDTDTYTELHFTSFELESGWTIEPVGSKPLIIYSQSTVQIDGTIQCSGRDGNDANADESIQVSGVEGRCGGASSGAGGYDNSGLVDASDGDSGGASITGGGGADSSATAGGKGGGGGGSYAINASPQAAVDGVNPDGGSGGTAGTNFRNDEFTVLNASSGGGGGAAFNSGTATQNSSGASGGSGGGLVIIYAKGNVTISATGGIYANGGAGGDVAAGLSAGAGGGGGGGGINIFSAGDIVINGSVQARAGSGGTANGNGGNGGAGGRGRTWIAEKDGAASGGSIEDPDTTLVSRGSIASANITANLITPTIDIGNSAPEFTAESFTQSLAGSSTSNIQYSSSDSSSFTPSWKSLGSLTESDKKRYWKFRIEIVQDTSTSFSEISLVDLTYDPKLESDFDLVGACGMIKPLKPSPKTSLHWIYFLGLPLLFWVFLRWRKEPIYF